MKHEEILQEFEKVNTDSTMPDSAHLELPPKIAIELGVEFTDYQKGKSLTGQFIVQEKHTNPMGVLQGGILSAMFDNVIGPLSYLAGRNAATTLELSTNFLRMVKPGEKVIIIAQLKAKGVRTMLITAEAFNAKGKTIGTCSSNILILKK